MSKRTTDHTVSPPPSKPFVQWNRILVPVDFSPASRLALRYGVLFARNFGASLMVMHVVESGSALDRVLGSLSFMARKEQVEEAERLLPALISEQNRAELQPEFLVESGAIADRIVAASRRERPDLIIMGTHGRSLIHAALMGSTTQDVLRTADVPVLTTCHAGSPQPIERILLAMKLSPESKDVAWFAEGLAQRTHARLIAFHAVDLDVEDGAEESTYLGRVRVAEARSTLDRLFLDAPRNTLLEARMAEDSVPATILRSAADHDVDMIVIGSRRDKGARRPSLASTGARIIREAAIPVLSVPMRTVAEMKHAA